MPTKKEIFKDGKTKEEYFRHGFLIPAYSILENQHVGRARWWIPHYMLDTVPTTPIPKINWLEAAGAPQRKTVAKLLNDCMMYSGSLEKFLSFVLHAFGDNQDKEPYWKTAQSEELMRWERNLDKALPLMLEAPWPYFTDFIEENSSKSFKDARGFFATPMQVTVMMAEMQLHDLKDMSASVYDPCVGTGNMLLAASNHSVNLYGQDIGYTVLMGCRIHCHLYVPWLLAPLQCLSRKSALGQANSLIEQKVGPNRKSMVEPYQEEKPIAVNKSRKKKVS
jgi:hypothetical protein